MLDDRDLPCHTTIYKRFQALKVKMNGGMFTVTGGGTAPVRLAVDSTGLKQRNRGGADPTQVEDPKRVCQAPRDGGCGHKEDTGSPGHLRQGGGFADARSAVR